MKFKNKIVKFELQTFLNASACIEKRALNSLAKAKNIRKHRKLKPKKK